MLPILDEIEHALEASLYIVALNATLAIPDICAALEYENNRATKKRYVTWYNTWVEKKYIQKSDSPITRHLKEENVDFSTLPGAVRGDQYLMFTGDECYMLRCAMLHQGQILHNEAKFEQIAFTTDGSHKNLALDKYPNPGKYILNLDITTFCQDIINSARDWVVAKEQHEIVQRNFKKIAKKHSNYTITGFRVAETIA